MCVTALIKMLVSCVSALLQTEERSRIKPWRQQDCSAESRLYALKQRWLIPVWVDGRQEQRRRDGGVSVWGSVTESVFWRKGESRQFPLVTYTFVFHSFPDSSAWSVNVLNCSGPPSPAALKMLFVTKLTKLALQILHSSQYEAAYDQKDEIWTPILRNKETTRIYVTTYVHKLWVVKKGCAVK